NFIPAGMRIHLQSENGLLDMGPFPKEEEVDPDLINAGKQTVTVLPGGSFFDSSMSFAMIRSGRVNLTVLGAMEVNDRGDIANWKIPGKMVKGMGGAMDLVASAKNIIVAMTHCSKNGNPKLISELSLPVTGLGCVKKIVSDMAVIEINQDGFLITELAPGLDPKEVLQLTGGRAKISSSVKEISL
ncbi:MAG: 3-oxoacid CoA-transferase subunit B, partial [Bacteroidota bacterium]|nr:3-oxoacid CoA-transferase subunit B [Bacteroidota bacterium]